MQKIVVVGSSNTDMVIKSHHLPAPGETILGGSFFTNPGGKGANQAVAAARLGGRVTFVAKVGDDIFGKQALDGFIKEGINTALIHVDAQYPSGVALITVDAMAENTIVVASGANAHLSKSDIDKAKKDLASAALVLLQLEIPLETVEYVAQLAKEYGVKTILNPAPACELPETLYRAIDIITPNETEAEILSGVKISDIKSIEEAARKIMQKGVTTVIVTMGAKGSMLCQLDRFILIPAPQVEAIDTTAAGDVFNGALAVSLAEGADLEEAVTFATKAASISVTRLGAQTSSPFRNELAPV